MAAAGGPREVLRRVDDHHEGQCEVFVQDPDGYLVMLAHDFGRRRPGRAADPADQ